MTEQRERGAAGRGTGPGRLWRKLAGRIPRLSRPWRLARNLACIVALVYLMWLLAGANAVTPQWAFRRAERLALVGPSELLGELEVTRFSDDDFRYLVGETEAGLVTAQMSGSWYEGYQARLNYREKTGDITLAPLENYWGSTIEGDGGMAYFMAVTDLPGAVYGELDLTV